jgi:fatty-acyl-CoA synthase
MRLIGDIARLGAKRYARRDAVRMGDRRVDFASLDARSDAIAGALAHRGIGAGDRVVLMAENCVEFLEIVFGVAKAGAAIVPFNFRYGPQELDFVMTDVAPAVVIAGPGYAQTLAESLERTGVTSPLITIDGTGPGTLEGLRAEPAAAIPGIDPAAVATILYTSGTTGRPKGVMATHDATIRLLPMYGIEGGLTSDDVMLVCMPLFHGGGLVIQALSALYFGATVVLFGKGFDPAAVLDVVDAEGVTVTLWTPSMLALLARSAGDRTSGIRSIWYGSSSITEKVFVDARRMFRTARFTQWYGTTEATSIAVLGPDDHEHRPRATGREIVSADVRIVDESGAHVAPGGIGEVIVAASGTVMAGYYNNPGATAATIRDGWLHTGDFAELDADGYFTIVGRGSDLIVTGGENVYPNEIEEVLIEHSAVSDVCVFGTPDEVYGEAVTAAVVAVGAIDPDELRAHVGTRLARYKIPRVIHVVDALPRNASGKVLRRELVAAFSAPGEPA